MSWQIVVLIVFLVVVAGIVGLAIYVLKTGRQLFKEVLHKHNPTLKP